MAGRQPGRGSDQFVVRLPDGMREKIAQAAEANGRSMNSEIVHRLSQSFENPPKKLSLVKFSEDPVNLTAALHDIADSLKLHFASGQKSGIRNSFSYPARSEEYSIDNMKKRRKVSSQPS